MLQKCVCGILGLKLLWHILDHSAVLLRIRIDGEELRPKVSTSRVNLGISCLVATPNVIKLSQRLYCNGLLRNKFFIILLLPL